jgi:predicted AAA+ superfamily ATPase
LTLSKFKFDIAKAVKYICLMYYIRDITDRLKELASTFNVVIVTGARQTGKTTLLKEVFPNYEYISLDLPSVAEQAEKQPQDFFSRHSEYLIIDEVQYAPSLFRHIKYLVDEDRQKKGRYILSGSQKFNLMKEVSESLAGRCAVLNLETFSFSEIKSHNRFKSVLDYQTMLMKGGFPELWENRDLKRQDFFYSYLSTYLERDVRQLLGIASLRDFERFIRLCASRNAQLLNKTELAKDVGVSATTINNWLSVMEASNQIVLLEPYYENLGKRIIKTPKLYFCDTGLLTYLLGLQSLSKTPFTGMIWETFIFSELRKYLHKATSGSSLWFYRDKNGTEVDFVIIQGAEVTLFECKWSELPVKQDAAGLLKVGSYFKEKKPIPFEVKQNFIVCRTETPFPIAHDVTAINGFNLAEDMKRHFQDT